MPKFEYKVKRDAGDVSTGIMEADSQRAVVNQLRDMGYFPISVEEHTGSDKKDFLRDKLIRVKLKDRNIFFRQLANLLESGMPILRAMTTLKKADHEQKDGRHNRRLA